MTAPARFPTLPSISRNESHPAFLGLAVVVSLLGLLAGVGWGQVVWPEAVPADNVLVMRSGEVFQGRITKNGDRFVVHVPVGEVSLRASNVNYTCATLMDAYARQRERIQPDTAQDHAELAQWCQRQGLLEAAWREIAEAKTLDPTLPMIALIQRRLEIAMPSKARPSGRPAGRVKRRRRRKTSTGWFAGCRRERSSSSRRPSSRC